MSRFSAIKGAKAAPSTEAQPVTADTPSAAPASTKAKAREGKVMVGGYFSPEARRKLHLVALDEGVTIQNLVGEGLDAVLKARGMPPLGER